VPFNVNLALLKAELLHARIQRHGLSLRERLFSSVDFLGKMGCLLSKAWQSGAPIDSRAQLLTKTVGIAWQTPLPHFARQRFDRMVCARARSPAGLRGRVILWDDTFVRYHSRNRLAAVHVAGGCGFEVELLRQRKCCGRPAFSQGKPG